MGRGGCNPQPWQLLRPSTLAVTTHPTSSSAPPASQVLKPWPWACSIAPLFLKPQPALPGRRSCSSRSAPPPRLLPQEDPGNAKDGVGGREKTAGRRGSWCSHTWEPRPGKEAKLLWELYNHCGFKGEDWDPGCHSVCGVWLGRQRARPRALLPAPPSSSQTSQGLGSYFECLLPAGGRGGGAGGLGGAKGRRKRAKKDLSCTERGP